MKKLLALGAASLIFAGCSTNTTVSAPSPIPDTTADTTQTTPTDTTMMTPDASASPTAMATDATMMPDGSMQVKLNTQNDLGQSGTATLTPSADGKSVVVVLALTGGTFTAAQPAHIHEGSCPAPGAVKYPLTNVVNGKSTTTLKMSMADLLKTAPQLAINVHKSADESSVYTACGNLQ